MKRSHPASHDDGNNKNKSSKLVTAPSYTGSSPSFETVVLVDGEAVVFQHMLRFLDWQDAVALGAVNKALYAMYTAKSHVILKPLLECLHSLIGSNVHQYCGKVSAPVSIRTCTCHGDERPEDQALAGLDPRYQSDYDEWNCHDKCAAMVQFIGTVVSNLRPHLRMNLDDAADPHKAPMVIGIMQETWFLEMDGPADALFDLYPRRSVLAFNLALIGDALGALSRGDDGNYEDAVLGHGDTDSEGSNWFHDICDRVVEMMPFDDLSLKHQARRLLPRRKDRRILGEALTRRLCLTAPMLEWIEQGTNNNKKKVVLLPHMERFHLATAEEAMQDWDLLEHGFEWERFLLATAAEAIHDSDSLEHGLNWDL